MTFSPVLEKETYSSKIATIIRTMIRDGELQPGEPIKETVLGERLSVSRAPIREALQELAYEGIVTSEPQKGKRVRLLSDKDIVDSYTVGGILESVGVSDSLAKWTDGDSQELVEIVDEMRQRSKSAADTGALMELDDQFHSVLLRHCDNGRLVEMARLSCITISKVLGYKKWRTLFSPSDFCQRHEALARVVATRNAEVIARALREHYLEIGERMVR